MSQRLRINQFIRAQTVRLIGDDGEFLGVVGLPEALKLAQERELDLIEVSPNAKPPVCKITDYGKHIYRQQKLERKQRSQQKQTEVKGIRIGFRTGLHDLEIKANQAKKFLKERNVVKVMMILRGRELGHMDLAREKMAHFADLLKEVSKIEDGPKRTGNSLILILAPGTGSVAQSARPAVPPTAPPTVPSAGTTL